VKASAPAAIAEMDTRDNLFTPTRGLCAETSLLVSRTALGSTDDFKRFQQLLMARLPLAHKRDAGCARQLRLVFGWNALLPAAFRPVAQRPGAAVPG
jgi:hypothetical protein